MVTKVYRTSFRCGPGGSKDLRCRKLKLYSRSWALTPNIARSRGTGRYLFNQSGKLATIPRGMHSVYRFRRLGKWVTQSAQIGYTVWKEEYLYFPVLVVGYSFFCYLGLREIRRIYLFYHCCLSLGNRHDVINPPAQSSGTNSTKTIHEPAERVSIIQENSLLKYFQYTYRDNV